MSFYFFVLFSTGGQLNKPLYFLVPTNNQSYWIHIT